MQAKDAVIPAGRRLGLMVLSSDREYTVRPAPGTQVSLDLAGTLVHAADRRRREGARDRDRRRPRGGARSAARVPATLALTLGAPASFGAFTPGVARDYTATHDGERDLAPRVTRR